MVIHVYALCWNEEKMLPYFFKHYDGIADQYYIFDNDSTDNSLSILQSHPKVNLNRFKIENESFVISARDEYNHFWQQSRGIADWVIICNVDEHLYHPNLRRYLQECTSNGITLIMPKGYEMVSDEFPYSNKPLFKSIRYGVRKENFDKPQIFNPNEIEEINFISGRHRANPKGNVIMPSNKDILLLHYKYLGFNYFSNRLSELNNRRRKNDIINGRAARYEWNERKKLKEFNKLKKAAFKVL